eukprot:4631393-Karenia_brevis.AAC.1
MYAESATGTTQISPGTPGRWHGASLLSAHLQVNMERKSVLEGQGGDAVNSEADSATVVTQISPVRPGRWHAVSTLSA